MRIVFVCSGNTCRSPMAAAMAAAAAAKSGIDVDADSAGLYAQTGMQASDNARRVMQQRYDIDLSKHRSKPLTKQLVDGADLILCMTNSHKRAIRSMFPNNKTQTLGGWAGDEQDIADPFGGTPDCYLRCAEQLESLISDGIKAQSQNHDTPV